MVGQQYPCSASSLNQLLHTTQYTYHDQPKPCQVSTVFQHTITLCLQTFFSFCCSWLVHLHHFAIPANEPRRDSAPIELLASPTYDSLHCSFLQPLAVLLSEFTKILLNLSQHCMPLCQSRLFTLNLFCLHCVSTAPSTNFAHRATFSHLELQCQLHDQHLDQLGDVIQLVHESVPRTSGEHVRTCVWVFYAH